MMMMMIMMRCPAGNVESGDKSKELLIQTMQFKRGARALEQCVTPRDIVQRGKRKLKA